MYVIEMETAGLCKLTSTVDSFIWSPEGNKIAFSDNDAIYVTNVDGTGRQELTRTVDAPSSALVWSPDGERIAFVRQGDLFVINTDGTGLKRLASKLAQEDSAVVVSWSRG
jgi:TolB protein